MVKEHKTGESQIELPGDFNSLAYESATHTFYFLARSEFDDLHVYDRTFRFRDAFKLDAYVSCMFCNKEKLFLAMWN